MCVYLFRNPRFVRYCEGYHVPWLFLSTLMKRSTLIRRHTISLRAFPMYSRCQTFKAVPCIWLSISTAVSRLSFPPRFMLMGERRAYMICAALLRTTWRQSSWCMPRAVSVCRWTASIILWASLLWFTVNCKC